MRWKTLLAVVFKIPAKVCQISILNVFTKHFYRCSRKERMLHWFLTLTASWSSPSVTVSNVLITARTTTLKTNQSCGNWNITDIVNFNTAFIGYMEISFFAHEIFQFASSVIPNLATLWLSKLRPFWSPWRGEKKMVTKIIIAVKVAHLTTCVRQ